MEHQAVSSSIEQLQAADVTSALQGILQQAQSVLKPPSRSAAAAGAALLPAASRHALVAGVLLLLERTAVLAKQQCDFKLIKDAHSQLVASFQQHPWLWELLLRKHLADLLQHPAAAQLFAEALARLPGSTQARAYRLWHQQLAVQPELMGAVPPGVGRVLSEQLKMCFQARTISLPLSPGLDAEEAACTAPGDGGAAYGLAALPGQRHAGTAAAAAAAAATEMHVVLREQLPHLLQLLLLIVCNGSGGSEAGAARAAATAAVAAGGGDGSGHESGNRPSLSSMQSAATRLHPPPRRAQQQQQQQQQQQRQQGAAASPASSASTSWHCNAGATPAGGGSSGGSSVQEGVLRHAVLLVGMLSDPDALHSALGIRGQRQQQQDASGSDSEGDGDGRQAQPEGVAADASGSSRAAAAAAAAAADHQAYSLSRRDSERVRIAQSLMEICLDGILTLPLLAAAVHNRLHSKGSSTGGGGNAGRPAAAVPADQRTGGSGGVQAVAAAVEAEEQAAAAAELRHTAGVMLALHRELSRFCLAQQPDAADAVGPSAASNRRRQAVQPLSPQACLKLLSMLATVQQPAEQGVSAGQPRHRRRSEVTQQQSACSQGLPALLLVPPQLVVQALELVRHAVESGSSAHGGQLASQAGASWRADLAAQAATIYTSCYQAMWGAQVLQSSDMYWRAAAQLGRLLRSAVCGGAAAPEYEAEAAAEAALLTRNAVGSRRRRQLSGVHDLPGLAGGSAAAAAVTGGPPPAKRVKLEHGGGSSGGAVAQLLQLFQPPVPAQQQQQQLQASGQVAAAGVQQQGRKRIVAVPVQQEGQEAVQHQQVEQQQQKPAHRRITAQQIAPASDAAKPQCGKGPAGAAFAASGALQQQGQAGGGRTQDGQVDEAAATLAEEGQCGQQRIVISKTANMTDAEQDALWEAYIADKDLMVEMLGDSDYQQWYDEAAHPLRRQQRRAGGLEAAWAAVLGSGSAGSLVQLQLPRTLLEASGSMPWDAAAAACLRLLLVLLGASGGEGGDSVAVAAEQRQQLLQRAFSPQMREAGAQAATRICHISEGGTLRAVLKGAQAAPAGGTLVLLATQLLGLVEGQQYGDATRKLTKETDCLTDARINSHADQQQAQGDRAAGRSRLVAPPLLDAYAGLLAALLPHAELEGREAAAAGEGGPGLGAKQQQHLRRLLSLGATVVQRLMLLPPPVHHMLGPGCASLLLLTVEPGSSMGEAVAQQSALLWMLVQQQLAGGGGRGGATVALPADAPYWVHGEACLLLPPVGASASRGHAMLLGPPLEVRQAAAAELLTQVLRQLQPSGSSGAAAAAAAAGGLVADDLLPAADACNAAIQLLLLEQRWQVKQVAAGAGSSDAGSDSDGDEEEEQQHLQPLLLGHAAAVGQLAAALCQAGAAAGAELAATLDAAAPASRQRQRQAQAAPDSAAAEAAAAAVGAAASTVALCNMFLEPADSLRQAACLPPTVQQQLEAACEALGGQNDVIEQLLSRLPRKHPLPAAALLAMEGAPPLWRPGGGGESNDASGSGDGGSSSEEEGGEGRPHTKHAGRRGQQAKQQQRHGGGKGGGSKGGGSSPPVQQTRRRKRLKDIRNPALRAMLAEDGGHADLDADELSDLEDFLVCNPERDYATFFRRHFYHVRDSESEGEEQEEAPAAAAVQPEAPAAAVREEGEELQDARGEQEGRQQEPRRKRLQAEQRQAAAAGSKPGSSMRTRGKDGGGKKGGKGARAH